MGAEFSNYADPEANAIYGALFDELNDEGRARAVMKSLHKLLGDLKSSVDAWQDWLMSAPNCPYVISKRKARTLFNACDMEFRLDSEADLGRRKRRAVAFILQGREAGYVHRPTALSTDYGFIPTSNQHDGLVTIGDIPTEAQEQAKAQSGLRHARLEEKAFFVARLTPVPDGPKMDRMEEEGVRLSVPSGKPLPAAFRGAPTYLAREPKKIGVIQGHRHLLSFVHDPSNSSALNVDVRPVRDQGKCMGVASTTTLSHANLLLLTQQ